MGMWESRKQPRVLSTAMGVLAALWLEGCDDSLKKCEAAMETAKASGQVAYAKRLCEEAAKRGGEDGRKAQIIVDGIAADERKKKEADDQKAAQAKAQEEVDAKLARAKALVEITVGPADNNCAEASAVCNWKGTKTPAYLEWRDGMKGTGTTAAPECMIVAASMGCFANRPGINAVSLCCKR